MIGTDFCIVSGFLNGADDSTPNIYCIDTQNTKANWVKRVSLSDSQSIEGTKLGVGISHGAEAVVGSRLYMCGGVRRLASWCVSAYLCFRIHTKLTRYFIFSFCSILEPILAQQSKIVGTTIINQTQSMPLQASLSLVAAVC